VSQLAFDEETGKQLEKLYRIADAVRRRRLVRAALAAAPGERVLDVGCGPGFYCAELVEDVGPDGFIVGVDASPQMLALARHRCEGRTNVLLEQADATSLAVAGSNFDAAVCVQVLEYVPDVAAGLAGIYRALRPGGRVVVWDVDWATVSWHSLDPSRMERVLRAWEGHLAHPSLPRTLAPALRAAGFDQVEMEAHSFASAEFDAETYGVALVLVIRSFVAGRSGVTELDAASWALEQQELGERGEYFFACTQFCYKATRPRPGAARAATRSTRSQVERGGAAQPDHAPHASAHLGPPERPPQVRPRLRDVGRPGRRC
jgi:SAM-dependent methyltransferase